MEPKCVGTTQLPVQIATHRSELDLQLNHKKSHLVVGSDPFGEKATGSGHCCQGQITGRRDNPNLNKCTCGM